MIFFRFLHENIWFGTLRSASVALLMCTHVFMEKKIVCRYPFLSGTMGMIMIYRAKICFVRVNMVKLNSKSNSAKALAGLGLSS